MRFSIHAIRRNPDIVPTYEEVIARIIPEVEFHQNRYGRGLAEIVRPGCRWLDLGAGTRVHDGWIGVRANELVTRASFLVGCDVVETHLGQNAHLHAAAVGDASALPFAAHSFDLVTANMV
ncbi:MAG: class I SAM-dependent methyltransferase, partial [Gemmatimonadota bacterium]|nr:class I SAM-dependent methyltransferase [Gemmatimonadota bacterium]